MRVVVVDVDVICDLARQAGLPITREVDDRSYGLRDFMVVDPVGFEIRLAQVLQVLHPFWLAATRNSGILRPAWAG